MLRAYVPNLIIVLVVIGLAIATLLGLPAMLALLLVILAIVVYSMAKAQQRFAAIQPDQRRNMQHHHLRQLSMVAGMSLILGGAAILLPVRPGFAGVLILALIIAVGLGRIVREVR